MITNKPKLHFAKLDANGKKTGSVCNSIGNAILTKDVLQSNCGSCERQKEWQDAMEKEDALEVEREFIKKWDGTDNIVCDGCKTEATCYPGEQQEQFCYKCWTE